MNFLIILEIIIVVLIIFYDKKGVPIFLYHQVNNRVNVKPEIFEEHLKIIKNLGMKTATITDYYENKISKNTVLITFDDGYYDNFKYVFPLLKKYNMKATIFLNTLYIGEKRRNDTQIDTNYNTNLEAIKKYMETGNGNTEQYMSWEEIKLMYESGLVDFQAHSHKHMPIFKNNKILGLTQKENMDSSDLFLYGKLEENYPIFRKRGEYTGKATIIQKEFFEIFRKYYLENLKEKFDKKEVLEEAQKFIDKNNSYFHIETDEEYENRIKEEFLMNKNLIEKNLGNKVLFFCWPWGHRSKETVNILKKLNVKGFISTKKGTNSLNPNWNLIRRIELRKYTAKKFKINLLVARNLILGKIYGYIS
ncbi:MAG: polysaccharide deacetylase family protein [Fusobacterium sp.]|nr:polysaccharide deacetylase family protein [Fusobacterium sp.]